MRVSSDRSSEGSELSLTEDVTSLLLLIEVIEMEVDEEESASLYISIPAASIP